MKKVGPVNLRCEFLTDPLAIDSPRPRLSWIPPFDQAAYHVVVTCDGRKSWDSGRVRSGDSLHIEYDGKPLQSRGRYEWRVRVWPRSGKPSAWSEPAFWMTGITRP